MCIRPDLAPSTAYKYGCKCIRCLSWKSAAAKRTNSKKRSYARSKAWRLKYPERWKEHQLNFRKKNRKPCRLCKGKMPFPSPGKCYCSEECRLKAVRANLAKFRNKQREKIHQHKTDLGCSMCGYNKCGASLDWHHTSRNKERRITSTGYFTPLEEKERAKCILLCSNCHRELHYNENKPEEKCEMNGDVYDR